MYGGTGNDLLIGDGTGSITDAGTVNALTDLLEGYMSNSSSGDDGNEETGTDDGSEETSETATTPESIYNAITTVIETANDTANQDDAATAQGTLADLIERAESTKSDETEGDTDTTIADGNDVLRGGAGDDLLFGMGGDDYLVGGTGSDIIFGGAGNDIIVYDADDYYVHGGSGIDFLVGEELTEEDISALLNGGGTTEGADGEDVTRPTVSGIEVILSDEGVTSLTSMSDLAEKLGITVTTSEDGTTTTMTLSDDWRGGNGIYTYEYNGSTITLTTSLTEDFESQSISFTLTQAQG